MLKSVTDAAMTLADQLGLLLQRRLRTGLHKEIVAGVHPAITPATYPIISGIARTGAMTAAALGHEIGIDRSLASRTAAALVDAGLLEPTHDPTDRRATLLRLTASGAEVVDTLRGNLATAINDRLQEWSEHERQEFAELFGRFVADLTGPDESDGASA